MNARKHVHQHIIWPHGGSRNKLSTQHRHSHTLPAVADNLNSTAETQRRSNFPLFGYLEKHCSEMWHVRLSVSHQERCFPRCIAFWPPADRSSFKGITMPQSHVTLVETAAQSREIAANVAASLCSAFPPVTSCAGNDCRGGGRCGVELSAREQVPPAGIQMAAPGRVTDITPARAELNVMYTSW